MLNQGPWSRTIGRVEGWIGAHSRFQIASASLLVTLLIGYVDYVSGSEITLSVIYAVPIAATAWFVSAPAAMGMALLSVFLWLGSDYILGLRVAGFHVWLINGVMRLLFYFFLIFVLARLRQSRDDLEARVEDRALALARETAERERLEQEMLEISEREQRRLGQDLHDGLCQHLTGTALAGYVLAERLSQKEPAEAEKARRIVDLIEEAISLARRMAKGLYPVEMQADGLMQALEEFAATTSEMFSISCRFDCPTPVLIRSPATATHLYRIAQEAVSNAMKHGRATNIVIALEEVEAGVRLSVYDDGSGLPPLAGTTSGMGLRIMADRAKMMGAQFSITSRADGGVELNCLLLNAGVN
jgi:signal transduction histidine kinase